MFNVSTTSSSTVTTNINAINASNSSDFADQNSMKQSTRTEMDVRDSDNMQMGEIITADDFDMQNDVSDQLELESSSIFDDDDGRSVSLSSTQKQGSKQANDKQGEGSTADTSSAATTTSPATTKTTATTTSAVAAATSAKELRNSVKQEITDASAMDIESISEKRANGLKVISNVQVSPNAILNVSLNSATATATAAAANETSSLNNMIIVSSLPSTSTGLTTSQQQQSQLTQLAKPQSLLKNLNEARTSSDTRNSKHTKANVDVSIEIANIFSVRNKMFHLHE